MKKAADILETTRLDRELTYAEISRKTRIPVRYLEAFDKDDVAAFPQEPYCSLMIKEYSSCLGLNPDETLCLFRRDHDRKSRPQFLARQTFAFTPQITYTLLIISAVLLFTLYLSFEYIKFNRPPRLKVDWPESKTKIIEVNGQTDPESTIKINDDLVVVNIDGSFKKKIELSTPEAKVVVTSRSPAGKSTVEEKIYK